MNRPAELSSHDAGRRGHLYGSLLGRPAWFIRRFGWRQVLAKPLHIAAGPLIARWIRPGSFAFRGATHPLFVHRYNTTWLNERAVEIPVARRFLAETPGRVLEIGNVMGHYGPAGGDVVDRFERGPRVTNCDALAFQPPAPYDAVLSISTFEHIGFDDETRDDGERMLATLAHVREALLAPGGRLLVTAPLGYNPAFDERVFAGHMGFDEQAFLLRTGRIAWREAAAAEVRDARYATPFPYGNAVVFGFATRPKEPHVHR
ncbi:MAG: hypothetical protein FJ221_13825 [Lentisphaerae bacterium]|nr:hypothetical protein [Lentisphaerota bacterium]